MSMSEQELEGRLNGLSLALEHALVNLYALSLGQSEKATEVVHREMTRATAYKIIVPSIPYCDSHH